MDERDAIIEELIDEIAAAWWGGPGIPTQLRDEVRDHMNRVLAAERRRVTREIEAPAWKIALCTSLNEIMDDEEAVEATGIAVAAVRGVVGRGVPEHGQNDSVIPSSPPIRHPECLVTGDGVSLDARASRFRRETPPGVPEQEETT